MGPPPLRESEHVDQLYSALAKAQGALGKVVTNKEVKGAKVNYKYAELSVVLDAVREPFTANGLAVLQMLVGLEAGIGLTTRLVHESGQWTESTVPMGADGRDPHATGSWTTYTRRYALLALAGLAPEDDDGHVARGPAPGRDRDRDRDRERPAPRPAPAPAPPRERAADFWRLAQDAERRASAHWRRWRTEAGLPGDPAETPVTAFQIVNHVATAAADAGFLAAEDLVGPNGKRDRRRTLEALDALALAEPAKVRATIEEYLEAKHAAAVEAAGAAASTEPDQADPDLDYPPDAGALG